MAVGTWEDFNDKFGFNDGASVEERDFVARDHLVRLLNRELPPAVRAVRFDRRGVHNPVLIVMAKVRSKTDPPQRELETTVDTVYQGKPGPERERLDRELGPEPELPEDIADHIHELIAEAYVLAEREMRSPKSWRPG